MGVLKKVGITLLVLMCVSAGLSIVLAIVNAVRGTSATSSSSSSSSSTTPATSLSATTGGATTSSATVTPAATAVPTTTCDKAACSGVIQSYLAKNWAYKSSDFGECKNCPVVSYPNQLPSS